ncbi:hypothetical protein H6P81_015248 [Aristolochia fimbriata]|uniref:Uncharacterized protein n=1 Tax=Aristolochia fimbriata TaxID=158543 RepID=A0AAV7E5L4_ARIFI|nr:hypothetical protein H6P81_015248 [Aristolochia fimbriata]
MEETRKVTLGVARDHDRQTSRLIPSCSGFLGASFPVFASIQVLRVDVLSVEGLGFRMLTTAKSAHSKKRTEMRHARLTLLLCILVTILTALIVYWEFAGRSSIASPLLQVLESIFDRLNLYSWREKL